MKQYILILLLLLFVSSVRAQLSLETGTSTYLIDFDNTFPGVSSGSYAGQGFAINPSMGQLDAEAWATTGMSDGAKDFGVSNTSGDHARGSDNGGVGGGGFYGFDVGGGNMSLGVQATSSDWTPGTITLKIYNNTTSTIRDMDIDYVVYVRNDQNYSSAFDLSTSHDNTNYSDVTSGEYTSPEGSGNTNWVANNLTAVLSGLEITPCSSFYIRWTGTDVSGGGSRDELALDDISITAHAEMICIEPTQQASNFVTDLVTSNSIQASFTGGTSDKYLVVQSTSATLGSAPVDGETYSKGSNIGNGEVIQYTDQTSIYSLGLEDNTTYYYFIFPSNDLCASGPDYLVSGILTTSVSTLLLANNYYDVIGNETCEDLKTALHNLIDGHTSVSYGSLWTHYQTTDDHLDDSGSNIIVWDMYTDNPDGAENEFTFVTEQCGTYQDEGDCYNREHTFPKSWWGGSTSAAQYTDIFTVVPTDGWVNGLRSNNPYGEVESGTETNITDNGSKVGSATISIPGYSGNVFEPIDDYKGDFARGYFYMATRYEDVIAGWENNTTESNAVLDGTSYIVYEPWVVDLLVSWHNIDPIDQKEIDRNESIYNIQGNRNPFIDHPEYVAAIWTHCGSMASDDCTYVTNTADDGLGSLRAAIDCAVDGDTITFSPDVYNSSIMLTTDSIIIGKRIVLAADVSSNITIAAATPLDGSLQSIFVIESCAEVSLIGLTIDGAFGPDGSAIRNDGLLTLENMTITASGNTNLNSVLQNRAGSNLILTGGNSIE